MSASGNTAIRKKKLDEQTTASFLNTKDNANGGTLGNVVARCTIMFDDQHGCQASVGFANQLACLSRCPPQQVISLLWLLSFMIKETGYLFLEHR